MEDRAGSALPLLELLAHVFMFFFWWGVGVNSKLSGIRDPKTIPGF